MSEHAPITRADAIAAGAKAYFTGKPCKRGHVDLRNVRNKTCFGCQREAMKAERARDPVAVRAKANARYAASPEKQKARSKGWYWRNRDRALARAIAYQQANFKRLSLGWKAWREANPEQKRLNDAAYHKAHPGHARAGTARRRAKLRSAEGHHTPRDVTDLVSIQRGRCANCSVKVGRRFHLDHIMPLALGGTNYRRNLQILCPTCNMRKKAMHPVDFARKNGRLV